MPVKKQVQPNTTVLIYNIATGIFTEKPVGTHLQVMDTENIVAAGNNNW